MDLLNNSIREFRDRLDKVMLKCMHSRIVLYGFGYSGRYVKWYAKYFHGINVDYIISEDMTGSQSYEEEIFRPTLLDFGYKDVDNSIIWVTEPMDDVLTKRIESHGSIKNQTYYDLYEIIYNSQYSNDLSIQPLRYLEYKLECDFVNAIDASEFIKQNIHSTSYRVSTEKEIFPILDACHCKPGKGEAIFDFGCGKGGAMVSFLCYGFDKVGGESTSQIYIQC